MSKRLNPFSFLVLLFSYLFSKLISSISHQKIHLRVFGDNAPKGSITQVDLIELSLRNLAAKKNRTIITIGGITIGIAIIVFLVSLGYGIQELVVNRVARLEEMSQMDVTLASGSNLKITDETLNNFNNLTGVKSALPLISVVGHINYNNSESDMAVYGVTSDFLNKSAIKPAYGQIFDNNQLVSSVKIKETDNALASLQKTIDSTASAQITQEVKYSINSGVWVKVRQSADPKSKILGYTRQPNTNAFGLLLTGKTFTDYDGKSSNQWLKVETLLWQAQICQPEEADCEDGKYLVVRNEDNTQTKQVGYIALISEIKVEVQTADKNVSETNQIISVSNESLKQAVVNKTFLEVLGIKEDQAVGQKFTTTFVIVGNLISDAEVSSKSTPVEYQIVGVTPDEKTPVFYVPFIDLRSLGINNYSQVKIEVDDSSKLDNVRQQIEAMGFVTNSVADTVSQINNLFATLRTVLALLGMMALSVAALGMFNTLTVSLMERTREVGLMKAMGMKSYEVKDLFMSESLIMGLSGGIFGLILGFILGKITGLILSIFAVFKGLGYLDVSHIPFLFVIIILILSLAIGLLTGIYPSRRATKISALNALRYE